MLSFLCRVVVTEDFAMAGQLLPDDMWAEIADQFPVSEPSPDGGRPLTDPRAVLTAILFVLKTGIAWEDLPAEAFGCSYKTCKRRLEGWAAIGLWSRLHRLFLARLREADRIDWSRAVVDTSSVKAPLGGQKPARIPRTAAGAAPSIAC
jgi:transposase